MDEIRAIIVGLGSMGRTHLQTLRARPGVRLVGVVRRTPAPPEDGVPVFTDLSAALALRPDLALVSTPHHLHFTQTRACLAAGCHALVEKPLTLRYAEAVELVGLARARGRFLVVGLQRRYEGLCRVFRDCAAGGLLGPVRLVHGFFSHRFTPDKIVGWRSNPADAGAGILDDSAPHLLDLLLLFAGGRVVGVESRLLEGAGMPVPHSFSCVLDTDAGATVSATGSYLAPAMSVQEEISILGQRGSLFARRFCRQWNPDPPAVFYKSADGTVARDYDLAQYPFGRPLPLVVLLDVLQGRAGPDALLTEASRVLETHRAVELIRDTARRIDVG